MEKDDLSLLAGMREKERKKLNSKGIFTITQLSFTFRPRRHPKRFKEKREKYHHSLKAFAIREKKIHIVGRPELQIEGTPVYLDVEGLPDRDFYYLIGMRVRNGDSVMQHSPWADEQEDEESIWKEFLRILSGIPNPALICYGRYETTFIRTMFGRYGELSQDSPIKNALSSPINLLTFIYGRVYFPVPSNGLKEIAGYYGFRWSNPVASGAHAIVWREMWEASGNMQEKEKLICYNAEDCEALYVVAQKVLNLQCRQPGAEVANENDIVDINKLKREHLFGFKRNNFIIPGLDIINKAAYWDYQRERVYLKTNRAMKRSLTKSPKPSKALAPNKIIDCQRPNACPKCHSTKFYPNAKLSKTAIDLKLTRHGIKRFIVRYLYKQYLCRNCGKTFLTDAKCLPPSNYGYDLMAYSLYQGIELRLPMQIVETSLNRLFGLNITVGTATRIKQNAAKSYEKTSNDILAKLCNGSLLHADETKISVRGADWFVWIFANMEEVAYICTETREGGHVQTLLKDFRGVLVSDFYAAYDGINCRQQKCLIHLIRDINDALYKHPYDEGLKRMAEGFTNVMRPIIETVDRFGLKHYFLKKHLSSVDRYYQKLSRFGLTTEIAIKIKERLEKNRDKLFTFLEYDGIPWNNNNAEHAVKPFAMLRHIIKGITSGNGLRDYLILLSICETCKYKGLDFLDFLRSGEKDIDAYAIRRRKK
ncbi:MAG: IS66 family transposase [Nitrospinae bacterium]|nr:IS66 family transposase [Nitrospinota bacterium]